MSGWIKWEKDLETDPRFLRITREITKRISNAPALQGLGACNAPAFANSIAMGALLVLAVVGVWWAYAAVSLPEAPENAQTTVVLDADGKELVEKLDKDAAEKFNALSDEEKAAFVSEHKKAD